MKQSLFAGIEFVLKICIFELKSLTFTTISVKVCETNHCTRTNCKLAHQAFTKLAQSGERVVGTIDVGTKRIT
jgi:hypothetical protein